MFALKLTSSSQVIHIKQHVNVLERKHLPCSSRKLLGIAITTLETVRIRWHNQNLGRNLMPTIVPGNVFQSLHACFDVRNDSQSHSQQFCSPFDGPIRTAISSLKEVDSSEYYFAWLGAVQLLPQPAVDDSMYPEISRNINPLTKGIRKIVISSFFLQKSGISSYIVRRRIHYIYRSIS